MSVPPLRKSAECPSQSLIATSSFSPFLGFLPFFSRLIFGGFFFSLVIRSLFSFSLFSFLMRMSWFYYLSPLLIGVVTCAYYLSRQQQKLTSKREEEESPGRRDQPRPRVLHIREPIVASIIGSKEEEKKEEKKKPPPTLLETLALKPNDGFRLESPLLENQKNGVWKVSLKQRSFFLNLKDLLFDRNKQMKEKELFLSLPSFPESETVRPNREYPQRMSEMDVIRTATALGDVFEIKRWISRGNCLHDKVLFFSFLFSFFLFSFS